MDLFIAWDGDHIGRQVGRMALENDVEGLRRVSQAIDRGNKIWQAWAESSGGSLVSYGGDEGRAQIPADRVEELPKIREQYQEMVDASVSVGVGMTLADADKALLVAKLRGGDGILFYTPEMDEEIARVQKEHPKSEVDKLAEEYLNKAQPGMNTGAHAGFSGASRPAAPSVMKPGRQQEEESMSMSPPESTHAADDFEKQFHDRAQQQDGQDQDQAVQSDKELETLKAQVTQILFQVKAQAPLMAQLKQASPETYGIVMNMVQAVIALARQLSPQPAGGGQVPDNQAEPMKKGEHPFAQAAFLHVPSGQIVASGAFHDLNRVDMDAYERGEYEDGFVDHMGKFYNREQATKMARDAKLQFGSIDPEELHSQDLFQQPPDHIVEKDEMKVPPTHHHLKLPPGSLVPINQGGHRLKWGMKVQHDDGKVSVKQLDAGMVMSPDSTQHPNSSRNPGAR